MAKFRKKPVVIEAVQFTGKNFEELGRFAGQCVFWLNDKCLGVRTLEDGPNGEAKHVADPGDWIVKGIKGEFYACKPDIFDATYESAPSESAQPPASEAGRRFPICKDHVSADWNQPSLDDEACVLCRLFYLEAQEGLLEEWQQRAKRAEDAIAEVKRPLDEQMARLNATVVRLNEENDRLRADGDRAKEG